MKKRHWLGVISFVFGLFTFFIFTSERVRKYSKIEFKSAKEKVVEKSIKEAQSINKNPEKITYHTKTQDVSPAGKIPLDLTAIKRMRDEGMTLQKIGNELGVSASTISNRLKEIKESGET